MLHTLSYLVKVPYSLLDLLKSNILEIKLIFKIKFNAYAYIYLYYTKKYTCVFNLSCTLQLSINLFCFTHLKLGITIKVY